MVEVYRTTNFLNVVDPLTDEVSAQLDEYRPLRQMLDNSLEGIAELAAKVVQDVDPNGHVAAPVLPWVCVGEKAREMQIVL